MVKPRSCSEKEKKKKKTIHNQFFKIFIPTQSSQRLRIPPDFIKYFHGIVPYKSTITNHLTRSWPVDMTEIDGNLYFHEGWEKFVHDNALEFGDFLVFQYAGKDDFLVKIFAKDGCLKGFANSIPATANSVPATDKAAGCSYFNIPSSEPGTSKWLPKKEFRKVPRSVYTKTSKFPMFKAIVRPANVNTGLLKLPKLFVRKHGKQLGSLVHLKVPSGAVWDVEVMVKSKDDFFLSEGWEEFLKYYSVLWNYVVFRYVGNASFNVTIFDMNTNSEIEYTSNPTHHLPHEIDKTKGSNPIKMAKAFKSTNEFFTVTMHKSYVSRKCDLNVPVDFAMKYFIEKYEQVELQVSDGRVWSTKFYWYPEHDKCYFDCIKFTMDNGLKVGDVCVFEMIDPLKPLINVVIFRK